MNDEHGFDHRFGHEDGKSQKMQANQGFRQALIIAHQPAKTRCPTKTAKESLLDAKIKKQLDDFHQVV